MLHVPICVGLNWSMRYDVGVFGALILDDSKQVGWYTYVLMLSFVLRACCIGFIDYCLSHMVWGRKLRQFVCFLYN